jgi:AcrR family transcriptional regulator
MRGRIAISGRSPERTLSASRRGAKACGIELNERSDKLEAMARTAGSHSQITGPKVRDAARALFARHGYAAVSMRQIAAAVGVQAGALYLYTPDKQTLLFELMKGHMDELLAAWAAVPRRAAPVDRLEDFVRFHIRFHLDRPEAVFLAYMELRSLEPANFAAVEALRRAYEDELEGILKDGVAAGDFRLPDTRLATRALIAMLTGITTWFRDDGRLTRDGVEELYWEMARRAAGA